MKIVLVIWIIGALFTLGYVGIQGTGYFESLQDWQQIVAMLVYAIFWPLILGHYLSTGYKPAL